MTKRHTVFRSMRDLGLAAWFGGSLMGSVGLEGATKKLTDPHDKALARVGGWTAWGPVNAAAMAMHVIGAVGLLATGRRRTRASAGGTLATRSARSVRSAATPTPPNSAAGSPCRA